MFAQGASISWGYGEPVIVSNVGALSDHRCKNET